MKCKLSFVTNSSSASFILTVRRNVTNDEFIEFMDEFKQKYIEEFNHESTKITDMNNVTIKFLRGKSVEISYWTPMLNDIVDDSPHFMKYLILKFLMNEIPEIEEITFHTTED